MNFTAVTYRDSIFDSFLRMSMKFGWIATTDIALVSEEALNACIKSRADRKPKDHEIGRV